MKFWVDFSWSTCVKCFSVYVEFCDY